MKRVNINRVVDIKYVRAHSVTVANALADMARLTRFAVCGVESPSGTVRETEDWLPERMPLRLYPARPELQSPETSIRVGSSNGAGGLLQIPGLNPLAEKER